LRLLLTVLPIEMGPSVTGYSPSGQNKNPGLSRGLRAVCDQLASLISSAENTRPEPAATAAVATTVFLAAENVDHGRPLGLIGRDYGKRPTACQGEKAPGCSILDA
jgi:hypothetical protein